MTRRTQAALSLALCLALSPTGRASAQEACFASAGAAAGPAQRLVSLHETVRLSAACEYALSAGGSYVAPGALAGRDADFVEIYRHVAGAGAAPAGDPRLVYARRRAARAEQHTLMLRYCAHYLVEEQLGFRVVPEAGSGGLRVVREASAQCDAGRLELRVAAGVGGTLLAGAPPAHVLSVGASSLDLPQGDWSIYAARPGSDVALRVGVFRTQRVITPLQAHLRRAGAGEAGAPLLFAARWAPDGPGLLLAPTAHVHTQELLWPELRTAADAGVLWLARRGEGERPTIVGNVELEASDAPSVRLPDSVVREVMRRLYGDAADALVPTSADWRDVFSDLGVCLTPSYHQAQAVAAGAIAPAGSACAMLASLAQTAGEAAGGAGDVPAQLCLRHAPQRMSAGEPDRELPEAGDCFRLPAAGASEAPPERVAVAGDRVTLEGHGLCVLIDGAPLSPVTPGGAEYELRPGLLEVRQGGGVGCASPQALARLRLPVLDPAHEWHPVGLYAGADENAMDCAASEGLVCPWRAIPRDERDTFAYIRPRQELAFRVSTSAPVRAALERMNGGQSFGADVPLLAGVRGLLGGARPPALFGWVTRDGRCPEVGLAELREQAPPDPDALLADATFDVFLLASRGDDQVPACLAQARFRSRPSRAFIAETVEDFLGLELGLLGDTQAVVFANDPVAMGLMLPLAWFRMTPSIRFIALEIGVNLTMGVAFPQGMIGAEASRLGVSLSWALSFGIPEYLPRILTVGGMLHGAAETSSIDDPIVSFFVGLNLATLVDLAGGR
ncbi:MAG: hypothetical protein KF729_16190 [Sandaracinaceae bacterium]|nr:hypothetical protein [Sandaracinaceae bacterium]